MTAPDSVDFFFSCASRYSYLAATQLEGIAARTGCRFRWRPLNNPAIMKARGANPFRAPERPSGQYDWSYREYDAKCWADFYGVPYVEPVNFRKDPPHLVRGCTAAEALGALVPFAQRLFRAIFVDGRVIADSDLAGIARDAGIAGEAFEQTFHLAATAEREAQTLQEALARGVFGVPTCLLGDRLFWGNDRLALLEHALRQAGPSKDTST